MNNLKRWWHITVLRHTDYPLGGGYRRRCQCGTLFDNEGKGFYG